MKDIQREVKALEVAMQVATDIQDKPYAYVVARIQEAVLGNTEFTEVHEGDGNWYISCLRSCPGPSLILTTPEGESHCYRLPISASTTMAVKFVTDFSSRDPQIQKQWCVFLPEIGLAYLRHSSDEIPFGAVAEGSLPRKILVQLQIYLNNLSRFLGA